MVTSATTYIQKPTTDKTQFVFQLSINMTLIVNICTAKHWSLHTFESTLTHYYIGDLLNNVRIEVFACVRICCCLIKCICYFILIWLYFRVTISQALCFVDISRHSNSPFLNPYWYLLLLYIYNYDFEYKLILLFIFYYELKYNIKIRT